MSFICSLMTDKVSFMTGDAVEMASFLNTADVAGNEARRVGSAVGDAVSEALAGRIEAADAEACRTWGGDEEAAALAAAVAAALLNELLFTRLSLAARCWIAFDRVGLGARVV